MKFASLFLALLTLFTFTSCKTQEDIRREKTVDSMNEQLAQTQQSTAAINTRFTTLEESLSKLNGQVEEVIHAKQVESTDSNKLQERLNTLEEANKNKPKLSKLLPIN